MFSRIRRRATYANVVATLALVFAMSGGALAAARYIITSTKQIKPSVLTAIAKQAKGDLDGAIKDYNEAIQLKPDLAEAYGDRGAAKGAKGDLDGAIADCNKAIQLKPDFAEAYFNRGLAKKAKGDIDGANSDHAKAIELKPGAYR